MPFLKEEKSEHERARWHELASQLVCARHCELPLSKMGSKGLFPVVAVPLAFFGTFFRFERKYCPPRGGSPTARAGVGASIPQRGFSYTQQLAGGFPLAPCTPLDRLPKQKNSP